jgi:hypothetical protein
MAAAQAYLHDIPSVQDVCPHLPAILGNIDINRRVQAHTPIDRAVLNHANGVAVALKGLKGTCRSSMIHACSQHLIDMGTEPLVTDGVVQTAELRARTVEAARMYPSLIFHF